MSQAGLIPSGKHKGRRLHELTKAEFDGLRSGWNGSEKCKSNPFWKEIEAFRLQRDTGAAPVAAELPGVDIEICATTSGHCHIHIIGVGRLRVSKFRLSRMIKLMIEALEAQPIGNVPYMELNPDAQFVPDAD